MNALFKGRTGRSLSGSPSPTRCRSARSTRRAAQQIVAACRSGAPQLVITWQARAAILVQALFPQLTASLARLANYALPGAPATGGTAAHSGWESRSPLVPSPLTSLADRATRENNEIPGQWEDGRP
jgi:hypothetical protein